MSATTGQEIAAELSIAQRSTSSLFQNSTAARSGCGWRKYGGTWRKRAGRGFGRCSSRSRSCMIARSSKLGRRKYQARADWRSGKVKLHQVITDRDMATYVSCYEFSGWFYGIEHKTKMRSYTKWPQRNTRLLIDARIVPNDNLLSFLWLQLNNTNQVGFECIYSCLYTGTGIDF